MAELGGFEFVTGRLRELGYKEDRHGKFQCPGHGGEDCNLGVTDRGHYAQLKCFSQNCSTERIMGGMGCEKGQIWNNYVPKGDKSRRPADPWVLPEGWSWRKVSMDWAHDEKGAKVHWEKKSEPHKKVLKSELRVTNDELRSENPLPGSVTRRPSPSRQGEGDSDSIWTWANARAEAEAMGYKGKKLTQGRALANGDSVFGFTKGWYIPSEFRGWVPMKGAKPQKDMKPREDAIWLSEGRKYLYNLPAVLKAKAAGRRVFLTAGPKDAKVFKKWKEVATTNFGGEGEWQDRFTEMLKPVTSDELRIANDEGGSPLGTAGPTLVPYELWIVRDRDEAGWKGAQAKGLRLEANGVNVRVCEPCEGKDVYEHAEAGFGVSDLVEVVDWRDCVWPTETVDGLTTEDGRATGPTDAIGASVPHSPSNDELRVTDDGDPSASLGMTIAGPSPDPSPGDSIATLHVVTGVGSSSGGGRGGDPPSLGYGGRGGDAGDWMPRGGDGRPVEFANTDKGNGKRFAHWFRGEVIWCQDSKKDGFWMFWDGARWNRDLRAQLIVVSMAKRAIDGMAREAYHDDFRGDRSALLGWMVKSQELKRITAMIVLARDEAGMNCTPGELDTRRDILACKNGTIELRTGCLREARKEDMITRLVPIDYDPDARTEHWAPFLDTVTGGDGELKRFLWRAVGYSLTGQVGEHCLFFLYGFGRNGKSTFVETVNRLLGQYAMTADSATLMVRDVKSQIRTDLTRLKEARMVAMEETQKGGRIDEGVVKWLTGGTSVVARPLYAAEVEFEPQWKFWVCGNHKPRIDGVDDGIWRRIRLVPFNQQIPIDKVDKNLPEKLLAEAAGILAWAVEGAKQWYVHGLAEPEKITEAVNEYRDEMDVIGHFLREETTVDRGGFITGQEMYDRFKVWAKKTGSYLISSKTLGLELKQRGMAFKKRNTGIRYLDLALVSEHVDQAVSDE